MAVKMERETEDEDCSADDVDEFWDDVDHQQLQTIAVS